MTLHCHLDLFCGASGDMLLGALLDAGVPIESLRDAVAALGIDGLKITHERVVKRGLAATRADVVAPPEHAHRHLPDILAIIGASTLAADIKDRAAAVFRVLARAEANVHGIAVDAVHFHEVGALDAIADVVGVVAGFVQLGVSQISCVGLPISHGTVQCEHGILPVPAPAVVRLMEGLPTYALDIDGETVTPTAAALLRVLVSHWGSAPPMTLRVQGYGAGRKDFARANVLRLWLGETTSDADGQPHETLTVLSTNLDDMNPQWLPPLLERLLAAGALDAWLTPILMKRGRPAHTLTVLCAPAQCAVLRTLVFRHTSTLGVREETVHRTRLQREMRRVETPWGPVGVKIARLPDGELKAAPEFADCRSISDAHDVPLERVYAAALDAWQHSLKASNSAV